MSFKYESSGFALTLDGLVVLNGGASKAGVAEEELKKASGFTQSDEEKLVSSSENDTPEIEFVKVVEGNAVIELLDGGENDQSPNVDDEPGEKGLGDFVEFTADILAAPTQQATTAQPTNPNVHDPNFKPPWVDSFRHIHSPMLRLHNEIVELCKMLEATEEEAAIRQRCVDEVGEVVSTIWPGAKTVVFGSFATGLYVPTSDIDLVVMEAPTGLNVQDALKALSTALVRKGIAKNMQVIGKARVPIIKFEGADTGIKFDVSFNVPSGPEGAALVADMLNTWPPMKPLVLMLKVFLQQRELNEVYSGGLGSYSLITLVASFLQLHASRRPGQEPKAKRQKTGKEGKKKAGSLEGGLGVLFVDLLRTYGRIINTQKVGISCKDGGSYFSKSDRPDWQNFDRPFLFAIEDPADEGNDIGRNSFNIMKVRSAFDWAYQLLIAPSSSDESLLARVLHLKPVLAGRGRAKWSQPYPKFVASWRGPSVYRTPAPSHKRERDSSAKRPSEVERSTLSDPSYKQVTGSESHMAHNHNSSYHTPHRLASHSSTVTPIPMQSNAWRSAGPPSAHNSVGALRSPSGPPGMAPMQWRSPTPPHNAGHLNYTAVPPPYNSGHSPALYSRPAQVNPVTLHNPHAMDALHRSRSAPPSRPNHPNHYGAAGGVYNRPPQGTPYGGVAAGYAPGQGGYHAGNGGHNNLQGSGGHNSLQGRMVAPANRGRFQSQHSARVNTHIRFDD